MRDGDFFKFANKHTQRQTHFTELVMHSVNLKLFYFFHAKTNAIEANAVLSADESYCENHCRAKSACTEQNRAYHNHSTNKRILCRNLWQ